MVVDFASFKLALICIVHLPSSYIDIIIPSFSVKCLRIEFLRMEGMITLELLIVEKYKCKVDQNVFLLPD